MPPIQEMRDMLSSDLYRPKMGNIRCGAPRTVDLVAARRRDGLVYRPPVQGRPVVFFRECHKGTKTQSLPARGGASPRRKGNAMPTTQPADPQNVIVLCTIVLATTAVASVIASIILSVKAMRLHKDAQLLAALQYIYSDRILSGAKEKQIGKVLPDIAKRLPSMDLTREEIFELVAEKMRSREDKAEPLRFT